HRRLLTRRKCQRIIILAAVERLTIAVDTRERIHRLLCIVAVYARLRGNSALQPVAVVMGAVAWYRADPPAVDRFADVGDRFVNLSIAFFHAQGDLKRVRWREVLEVQGL